MTPLDIATITNATIAALALAFRSNMLKPEIRAWSSSRPASLIIMGLSVTMGGVAIDIYSRGHATPREAAIVTAMAISSVAMLVHLWMQRHQPQGGAPAAAVEPKA